MSTMKFPPADQVHYAEIPAGSVAFYNSTGVVGTQPGPNSFDVFAAECHAANDHWWRNPATGRRIERNKSEMLMLMVSEISEAMEAERKDLMDDKLPHRKGAEVELADAIIRLADYVGAYEYLLDGDLMTRPSFIYPVDSENRAELLLCIVRLFVRIDEHETDNAYWIVRRLAARVVQMIEAYCVMFGYDLWGAVAEKRAYNATRADHTNAARLGPNGKKF